MLKLRMYRDSDKSRAIPFILMGIITLVSGSLAVFMGAQKGTDIKNELSGRSQTIAAAIGPLRIMDLKGTSEDADTSSYADLKRQLAAIKKTNHDVSSIYLAGQRDGRVFFYVDSEQPDSPHYSPAAEWYDDASTALKQSFRDKKSFVEGPLSDEFGSFISGMTPITDPGTSSVIAVLGVDVHGAKYWKEVALAASIPATAGLSLLAILTVFEWMHRRNRQLLALRSELVSVASHELRTPIIGIKWAAESLETIVTDQAAQPYIRAIRNSATSLQASADDILELTYAINNHKVRIAPTDISKLIQDVFDTQGLAAQQKGVTLTLDDSIAPDLRLPIDGDKMKRVLHNMISNALKYTRDNTTVTVSYQGDEHMHRLLISDQGIGIPATEQGKVLEGFYRASNAIASKVQGTGLGLYLVKTVLEQHGGKVSFVSEEDKGTTFTLSIPKR